MYSRLGTYLQRGLVWGSCQSGCRCAIIGLLCCPCLPQFVGFRHCLRVEACRHPYTSPTSTPVHAAIRIFSLLCVQLTSYSVFTSGCMIIHTRCNGQACDQSCDSGPWHACTRSHSCIECEHHAHTGALPTYRLPVRIRLRAVCGKVSPRWCPLIIDGFIIVAMQIKVYIQLIC